MPEVLVSTAEAVLAALNGAEANTFSQKFEAELTFADWELPLEESQPHDRVLVDVVPVGFPLETELQTRGTIGYKPATDVVVRRGMGPERREANGKFTTDEIKALVLFVQELSEFFTAEHLPTFASAAWEKTDILAAYKPSHLRQYSQFTGIIRVTFSTDTDL